MEEFLKSSDLLMQWTTPDMFLWLQKKFLLLTIQLGDFYLQKRLHKKTYRRILTFYFSIHNFCWLFLHLSSSAEKVINFYNSWLQESMRQAPSKTFFFKVQITGWKLESVQMSTLVPGISSTHSPGTSMCNLISTLYATIISRVFKLFKMAWYPIS